MRVETSRAGGARRSGLGFGAAILTSMLVLGVVTLVAGLVFVLSPGGTNSVAATFLKAQPGSIPWDGSSRLNLLFMGLSRSSGPADSLMIVSYDPSSRTIKTLSVPMNLWVTVPGAGQFQIADAYSNGGVPAVLRTVQSVTHVVIPYYLVMTDATFAHAVDAFGGVTLKVDAPLGRTARGRPIVDAGRHHVTGTGALAYALSFGPYDTDGSARLLRQQALLRAMIHRVLMPENLFRIPQIVNSLGSGVLTNFPYNQIPDLSHGLTSVPQSSITGDMIGTQNGTASSYRNAGQTVLLPDRQRIPSLARRLFPDEGLRNEGSVAVLNGSGVSGQATGLATWLGQTHVRVGEVASAPSYNFARTQVRLAPGAPGDAVHLAHSIGTLLQVPVVRRSVPGSKESVAVIIGQDYQDPTQQ